VVVEELHWRMVLPDVNLTPPGEEGKIKTPPRLFSPPPPPPPPTPFACLRPPPPTTAVMADLTTRTQNNVTIM
jgi:hypothetical protein